MTLYSSDVGRAYQMIVQDESDEKDPDPDTALLEFVMVDKLIVRSSRGVTGEELPLQRWAVVRKFVHMSGELDPGTGCHKFMLDHPRNVLYVPVDTGILSPVCMVRVCSECVVDCFECSHQGRSYIYNKYFMGY